MAKLITPKYAYTDVKYPDGLYHFAWGNVNGPSMVCGAFIWLQNRKQLNIKKITPEKLCGLCLGALVAND